MSLAVSAFIAALLMAGTVYAEDTVEKGTYTDDKGGSYTWEITGAEGDETLTVSVNGESSNPASFDGVLINSSDRKKSPLQVYEFQHIVIGEGIKNVDMYCWRYKDGSDEGDDHDFEAVSLSLPSTLTNVGDDPVIRNFRKLTKLEIAEENEVYSAPDGKALFNKRDGKVLLGYLPALTEASYTVPSYVEKIGDDCFAYNDVLTGVTLSQGVKKVASWAFGGCKSLKTVEIPASVTTIEYSEPVTEEDEEEDDEGNTITVKETYSGVEAFPECASLESLNVNTDNTVYSSESGVLFNKDKTTLFTYPDGRDTADHIYTVPSGVTKIDKRAFWHTQKIKGVVIPKSVKSVTPYSFGVNENVAEDGIRDVPEADGHYGKYSITDIYYEGSEDEWKAIFGSNNYDLTLHYGYSSTDSEVHKCDGKGQSPSSNSAKYVFDASTMSTLIVSAKVDISSKFEENKKSPEYKDSAKHRYTSSDKKTAAIDKKGNVKAKKNGEVDFYYEQKEKGSSWKKIGDPVHMYVQLPVMEKKVEKKAKANDTLDAFDFFKEDSSAGTTFTPTEWVSSKPAVAEVDKDTGVITVKKKGSAKIIAVYGEGKGSSKKKYKTNLKITISE